MLDFENLSRSQYAVGIVAVIALISVLGFIGVQGTFFDSTDQWLDWCSASSTGEIYEATGCTYDLSNEINVGSTATFDVDPYARSTSQLSPNDIESTRNFYGSFVQDYFDQVYREDVGITSSCTDYTSGSRIEVCGEEHQIEKWISDHGGDMTWVVGEDHYMMELRLSSIDFILEEVADKGFCTASFTGTDSTGESTMFTDVEGDLGFHRDFPSCRFDAENISSIETRSMDMDITFVSRYGDVEDSPPSFTGSVSMVEPDFDGRPVNESGFVNTSFSEPRLSEDSDFSDGEFSQVFSDVLVFSENGSVVYSEERIPKGDSVVVEEEFDDGLYEAVRVSYRVETGYDWVSGSWGEFGVVDRELERLVFEVDGYDPGFVDRVFDQYREFYKFFFDFLD